MYKDCVMFYQFSQQQIFISRKQHLNKLVRHQQRYSTRTALTTPCSCLDRIGSKNRWRSRCSPARRRTVAIAGNLASEAIGSPTGTGNAKFNGDNLRLFPFTHNNSLRGRRSTSASLAIRNTNPTILNLLSQRLHRKLVHPSIPGQKEHPIPEPRNLRQPTISKSIILTKTIFR